ncbi:UDP-glucuronosyltransferase 2B18-like [Elephas maximus indicus]|uniref:UDP-glucuronosyltransferase 2B18-like n=1 Tax=Elephas maximus indicus TaxID=99487 RepID=UPI0021163F1C|nr:UDP-glucuronosyltransferase 2B18-like [Elephas maximus indicus]
MATLFMSSLNNDGSSRGKRTFNEKWNQFYSKVLVDLIESTLAKIAQKVEWRFDSKTPDILGPNTWLYEWIPQNDLLGHQKTKAFITRCGTNGIYEAIYLGIPMVELRMFIDQPDNFTHMEAKGADVHLNLNTMSSTDLVNALNSH